MKESFLDWEGRTYRLEFGKPDLAPDIPTAFFRVDGGKETPVDGTVWATLLFEGTLIS